MAWIGSTNASRISSLVATITFMVVFFPVIFLSGLAKFLFTPLATAVLFAVIASYLIAIFFVPVAAARMLGRKDSEEEESLSSLPSPATGEA